ncbi:MAG TPA: 4-hydroxy-3-methylbut-2-enyl diphosphate reductase [Tepidisphaeraceae bacterium]|jgi:4-hydroxy-3-methylbut-2-enyl diphosphate reductase|nr:4-hydroxy-3-methylbut-2-enyl diphosphate reductase [Tepidisphaeraceae bacterium]
MKVLLANPRGFCAGVEMAVEVVDKVLELKGPPIFVFHEIVHNRHVVEDFQRRGVTFINNISEAPPGSIVVYSAHGISPAIRLQSKQRNLTEIDATCPLVTKVHLEVLRFAKQGYTIFFIGHANHDEAVGTAGEAPHNIIVIESPEDVPRLSVPDENKVAYVTQTTLSVSEAQRTIEALKSRFPHIKAPPKEDICYATTNRQKAVAVLSPEVDLVLVIGSKNSSNSQRLVDTAREAGKRAHLIDDARELDPKWLQNTQGILVTAGASAPEHLVNQLLDRLKTEFQAEIELRTLVDEGVSFSLPQSLKTLSIIS